jgi:hypothetical protein
MKSVIDNLTPSAINNHLTALDTDIPTSGATREPQKETGREKTQVYLFFTNEIY